MRSTCRLEAVHRRDIGEKIEFQPILVAQEFGHPQRVFARQLNRQLAAKFIGLRDGRGIPGAQYLHQGIFVGF